METVGSRLTPSFLELQAATGPFSAALLMTQERIKGGPYRQLAMVSSEQIIIVL